MNAREIRKAELEGEIENATTALENQLSEYKDKGQNLLVILGIISTAYVLYRLISSDDEEKESVSSTKKTEAGLFSGAIWGLVGTAVMAFTKEKITEFINKRMNEEKS